MSVHVLIVLDLLLALMVGLDLVQTLRTGRAHGRGGIITRKGRPQKFWRYVYASCAVLTLCGVALVWILLSPESFASAGTR